MSALALPGMLTLFLMYTGTALAGSVVTTLAATASQSGGRIGIAFQAVFTILSGLASERPRPLPKDVHITLKELRDILISLSSITSVMTDEQLEAAAKTTSFKREVLVWKWFLEAEDPTRAQRTGVVSDSSIFSANPMKFEEFVDVGSLAARLSSIGISLRITVDDPESCDEDNPEWDVVCGRRDAGLLGLAAVGILDDLEALRQSIIDFQRSIDRAIEEAELPNARPGSRVFWYDNFFFAPVGRFLERNFRGISGEPNQTDAQRLKVLGIQRLAILKQVRDSLDRKLVQPFFGTGNVSAVVDVENAILDARNSKQYDSAGVAAAPPPRETPPLNERVARMLPQKATSVITLLFEGVQAFPNEFLDVEQQGEATVTIREFSSLHDARNQMQSVISQSRRAIRNLLDGWESAYATRCRFVQVMQEFDNSKFDDINLLHRRIEDRVDSYALVLQQPSDVGVAMATASLTERRSRELRYVSKRQSSLTRKGSVKTLFDAIGVPNTEAHFVAVSLFAEFWMQELVDLVRHGTDAFTVFAMKVVAAMQPASVRAAERMLKCAAFIMATTLNSKVGFFEAGDVAFEATRAGADAKFACMRLHAFFSPTPQNRLATATGSFQLASRIREVATAMRTTALLFQKNVPRTLPSEPLQSLFWDDNSGPIAVERITRILQGIPQRVGDVQPPGGASEEAKNYLIAAVTASYASNLLGLKARNVTDADLRVEAPSPGPAMSNQDRRRIFAARAASLSLNVSISDAAATRASVDELVSSLEAVSVRDAEPAKSVVFYVPHGYGDVPPPLTAPGSSSPMFGSTPVYTTLLAESIGAFYQRLNASEAVGDGRSTTIRFVFWPCDNTGGSVGPVEHPLFVLKSADSIAVFGSRPEQHGGGLGGNVRPPNPTATLPMQLRHRAESFVVSGRSNDLSEMVSSLAWNSERVTQAVCLALSQPYDGNDAVEDEDGDDGLLRIAFDLNVPEEPFVRPTQLRSRRSLLQLQMRARSFARNHVGRVRQVLTSVREGLIRTIAAEAVPDAQAVPEAPAAPAAPAAPEGGGGGGGGDGAAGQPADDGGGVIPQPAGGAGEVQAAAALPATTLDSVLWFGAVADGYEAEGTAPTPASLEAVVQKLLATPRRSLTQSELDLWILSPDVFELAVFEAFVESAWEGVEEGSRGRQEPYFQQYRQENATEFGRMAGVVLEINVAKERFAATLVGTREEDGAAMQQQRSKRLRTSQMILAASASIGVAMASKSVGAGSVSSFVDLEEASGVNTPVERQSIGYVLNAAKVAMEIDSNVGALRLSEVCAVFATIIQEHFDAGDLRDYEEVAVSRYLPTNQSVAAFRRATLVSNPSELASADAPDDAPDDAPRNVPRPLFTTMRANVLLRPDTSVQRQTAFLRAPLQQIDAVATAGGNAQAGGEIDLYRPLLGMHAATDTILASGPLTIYRVDNSTRGRVAVGATLFGMAEDPNFRMPEIATFRNEGVAWFSAPSAYTVSLLDGSVAYAPPNFEVVQSMIAHFSATARAELTTDEWRQMRAALASLLPEIAFLDQARANALEAGELDIRYLDQLCRNYADEVVREVCNALDVAGFTRRARQRPDDATERPVYELPAPDEDDQLSVTLPGGQLQDIVARYGQAAVSNALCTLFGLSPATRWTVVGDTATRRVDTQRQLASFNRVVDFVRRNWIIIVVMTGLSGAIAHGLMTSSLYGDLHPAISASAADVNAIQQTQGVFGGGGRTWEPPSITVNLNGPAAQFRIALGPFVAEFGTGSAWDMIPTVTTQPPGVVATGGEGAVVGAGGGGILAQQQDETAEYSLSQMLGDFMYYVIVYGYT